MAYWRSFKSQLVVAILVAFSVLAVSRAFAQEGATGSPPATGGEQAKTEFKKDLPTEVPDEPAKPETRPAGSFVSTAAAQGGAMFWVVVVLGIIGILVSLERYVSLIRWRMDVPSFMGEVIKSLQDKGVNGALEVCSRHKGPVSQLVAYGLQRAPRGAESVEKAIATASLSNLIGMRRGMGVLSFIGQTAPLLGFLGTIMNSLAAVNAALDAGRVNAAMAIGGFTESVSPVIAGVIVAILVNIFVNLISARIDRMSVQMEEAGDELVDALAQSQGRLKGRTA